MTGAGNGWREAGCTFGRSAEAGDDEGLRGEGESPSLARDRGQGRVPQAIRRQDPGDCRLLHRQQG